MTTSQEHKISLGRTTSHRIQGNCELLQFLLTAQPNLCSMLFQKDIKYLVWRKEDKVQLEMETVF